MKKNITIEEGDKRIIPITCLLLFNSVNDKFKQFIETKIVDTCWGYGLGQNKDDILHTIIEFQSFLNDYNFFVFTHYNKKSDVLWSIERAFIGEPLPKDDLPMTHDISKEGIKEIVNPIKKIINLDEVQNRQELIRKAGANFMLMEKAYQSIKDELASPEGLCFIKMNIFNKIWINEKETSKFKLLKLNDE